MGSPLETAAATEATESRVIETEGDIRKAVAIEGFMTEPSLHWLAERAREHHCIVEVGSYLGRSTRALADNTDGIVYAFDNWRGPWDVNIPDATRQTLLGRFQLNLADHLGSGRVVMIVGDHRLPPTGLRPDMVFIDGNHDFPSVCLDVAFWRSQLPPGGLLCGDDWSGYIRSDVIRAAVTSLLPIVEEVADGRLWAHYV